MGCCLWRIQFLTQPLDTVTHRQYHSEMLAKITRWLITKAHRKILISDRTVSTALRLMWWTWWVRITVCLTITARTRRQEPYSTATSSNDDWAHFIFLTKLISGQVYHNMYLSITDNHLIIWLSVLEFYRTKFMF